jgi:hypothetical protein
MVAAATGKHTESSSDRYRLAAERVTRLSCEPVSRITTARWRWSRSDWTSDPPW